MEFSKCSRCGSFYVSGGNVCPNCSTKDSAELSTFKTYVEENGLNGSLDSISGQTGISVKNLNRFLGYDGFKDYQQNTGKLKNIGNTGVTFN